MAAGEGVEPSLSGSKPAVQTAIRPGNIYKTLCIAMGLEPIKSMLQIDEFTNYSKQYGCERLYYG